MKRKARICLLVSAALLLLGATAATSAQALEFHLENAEGGKVTGAYPKGEKPSEGEVFNFITNQGIAPCFGYNSTDTVFAKTVGELTLHPVFSGCFFSTSMGACHFVLHASGSFDIAGGAECGSGEPISIQRGSCLLRFPAQEGKSKVTYVNNGTGSEREITATFAVTGLRYVQTGALCSKGAGEFLNGELKAIATLRGDTPEAKPQGLWIE